MPTVSNRMFHSLYFSVILALLAPASGTGICCMACTQLARKISALQHRICLRILTVFYSLFKTIRSQTRRAAWRAPPA